MSPTQPTVKLFGEACLAVPRNTGIHREVIIFHVTLQAQVSGIWDFPLSLVCVCVRVRACVCVREKEIGGVLVA